MQLQHSLRGLFVLQSQFAAADGNANGMETIKEKYIKIKLKEIDSLAGCSPS
jgi:hypothetical protein